MLEHEADELFFFVSTVCSYHPLPVVFDRAQGAKVWDPEGNEYIDMLAAYSYVHPSSPPAPPPDPPAYPHSAVNQGHCHPAIVHTLTTQAQKLTLSSRAFYNSTFGRFAETLTALFGYEMVLPMNTGAEAVETALKLARKWAYERKRVPDGAAVVLSAAGNFHGRTLGVISMSTDPESRGGFGPYLANVGPAFADAHGRLATPFRMRMELVLTGSGAGKTQFIRYGVIEDLEHALAVHGEHVAAFLVEPIQGEAGSVSLLCSSLGKK
jgi:ornithine--oxo-acid transaminase